MQRFEDSQIEEKKGNKNIMEEVEKILWKKQKNVRLESEGEYFKGEHWLPSAKLHHYRVAWEVPY